MTSSAAPSPSTSDARFSAQRPFDRKVALVTGGSTGIGESTAKVLADRGASVVIAARNEQEGRRVVSEIEEAGGTAAFIRTDVSDESQVEAAVRFAVDRFGGLDVALNNAGVLPDSATVDAVSLQDWQHAIDVDLTGTFLCVRAETRHMLEHGGGAIVNTASDAGLKAAPQLPAYTAAKHGVIGLTRAVALDFADRGIRINAVAPGTIATPMVLATPPETQRMFADAMTMQRMGTPEEVADLIAFLLSDAAGFISGVTVPIDGASLQSSRGI